MKIDIIGSVASGKTTLAKQLSERYGIPHIEKDNLVWERLVSGDKKRSTEEQDALFQEVLALPTWIVEGSPRKNLQESFALADWIILLEPPLHIRLYRGIRRWWRSRKGLEPTAHGTPTLAYLVQLIKWIVVYDRQMKQLSGVLDQYWEKVRRFRSAEEVFVFLEQNRAK